MGLERAYTPFEARVAEILTSLHSTLVSKNADYGDSYAKSVEKYGKTVTLIRLGDKFGRLENLITQNSHGLVEETEEETLLDLAGYAILELERRERKRVNDQKKPPYADLDD